MPCKEGSTHHHACACREERFAELEQQNAALRTELARFANEDYWERCFAECRDEHVWAYIGPDHTMPVQETPSSIATAALSVPWASDLRERVLAAVEVECKLGTITLQAQTPSSASCNNEQLPEEKSGGKA